MFSEVVDPWCTNTSNIIYPRLIVDCLPVLRI